MPSRAGYEDPAARPLIEARRLLPSRWDLLAAVLVLSFIILFADASMSKPLVQPLSSSMSPAII